MMYAKQTPENFASKKDQVISEYLENEKAFGWKFKTTTQKFGDVEKFYITSGDMNTIITYDQTTKYMKVAYLLNGDIKILNTLKEGL